MQAADSIVSADKITLIARKITGTGTWEQLALLLYPGVFTTTWISTVKQMHAFSPVMQATYMLEQWSHELAENATCRKLIEALCEAGDRATAATVFGIQLVQFIRPHSSDN